MKKVEKDSRELALMMWVRPDKEIVYLLYVAYDDDNFLLEGNLIELQKIISAFDKSKKKCDKVLKRLLDIERVKICDTKEFVGVEWLEGVPSYCFNQ